MTNPRILFLDGSSLLAFFPFDVNGGRVIEPTTGLDSHTAASVMRSVKALTTRGGAKLLEEDPDEPGAPEVKNQAPAPLPPRKSVTVICSIHQPSNEVLIVKKFRALYSHCCVAC